MMTILKDIYLLNYLKTHRFVSKYYKDEVLNMHYASYFMIGKMTICLIYPFLKLMDLFNMIYLFKNGSKVFFLIIAVIFFLMDYFFVRKKFKKILKYFKKKSDDDLKKIHFHTQILIILIVIVNLFFLFFI